MLKSIKLYFIFVWTIISLLVCSFVFAQSLSKGMNNIINRGEIIVALPNVNHSVFFREGADGKLVGHDIDFAKDIAKKLGVRLKFDRSSPNWDGIITLVQKGKADIALGNVSKTLERHKRVSYTHPYLILNKTLLVSRLWLAKKDFKYPAKDLMSTRFTIGAITGNAYAEFAKKAFPKAVIKLYPSWEDSLQGLLKNEVVSVFQDDFKIRKFILEQPKVALNYKAIIYRDYKDYIAIPVSYNNIALLNWLNFYLKNYKYGFNAEKLIKDYVTIKDTSIS